MNAILLIEDNLPLGTALARALRQAGYNTTWVRRLMDAQKWMTSNTFDAIVLDLGLPDGEGHVFLEELRAAQSDVPVIIASARDALSERLKGLDEGADDFLVKPFPVDELVARLRAVLRRHAGQSTNRWSVGSLVVEPSQKRVTQDGNVVELTPREYQLLFELVRRAHRWVTRETLMDALYREGNRVSANALEVVIHHLRGKLGEGVIQTIRGVGYMIGGNR
ncbi:response regulator [Ralstonia solanacearum]|uniref:response regulator n=1 Tax=Ralstonia solanacearum TaxID=305 RepID=UPI003217DE5A